MRVGDKVRRKPEHRTGETWGGSEGTGVFTVKAAGHTGVFIQLHGVRGNWRAAKFNLLGTGKARSNRKLLLCAG